MSWDQNTGCWLPKKRVLEFNLLIISNLHLKRLRIALNPVAKLECLCGIITIAVGE
jgi:hypothetical protein